MNLPFRPTAIALMVAFFSAGASAQVQCEFNSYTTKYQATLAWRNSLGAVRADEACQNVAPPQARTQVQPNTPVTESSAPVAIGAVAANVGPRPAALVSSGMTSTGPVTKTQGRATTSTSMPFETGKQADGSGASATSVQSNFLPAYPGQTFANMKPTAYPPQQRLVPAQAMLAQPQNTPAFVAPPQAFTPQQAQLPQFTITQADGNFRTALARWSASAGWSFGPEHWASDRDIPVDGSASFTGDFKSSVKGLLKTTEMSDRALQPCFYSNNVLRVIAASELCSRSDN